MSDKDTVTKEYMQDCDIFADVFNYLLYDGRQVIKPEQLKPIDTTAIVLPHGEGQPSAPLQKYRDVFKMVTAMEDDNAAYLLLGIENQSQMHYAMPVRNMLYDAMQYVAQVEDAAKSHRSGREKAETGAEYLSGFYRTDRLLPVITLTLYFGADEWTAPKDLHGMLAANENIMRFVDNYHLHLVAPADIAPEDFDKFHTELRLALKYLKYSRDKQKLNEAISEDTGFQDVSRKTADMINIVTGSRLSYHQGEERVNMCIAIEEMRKDAIAIGIAQEKAQSAIAIQEAREQGIAQERAQSAIAIQEAREQGIAQEKAQSAIAIQKAKEQGIEQGIEKGIEQGIEKGIEQGIEQGIELGIEQGIVLGAIKICHDLGMESNDILTRITGKFSLTRDEAESYMRQALANA